jgi:hypothetical protein
MLDLRGLLHTPGATTTLGTGADTIPTNDGAQVAGVPLRQDAVLRMWGVHSVLANTIAIAKLQSQDMVDPINGVTVTPGTTSLLNQWFDYTTLPYKTGARYIQSGTNTAQAAQPAFTIDEYPGGSVMAGKPDMGNDVVTPTTTYGGALTSNVWGSQPYAPAFALPNGRYMIHGVHVKDITAPCCIRFRHADFGFMAPGFPVVPQEIISTTSWDKVMKDDLTINSVGEQFDYLSKLFGRPCCPVFSVTNAGTGLNFEILSNVANTPTVDLFLSKVG